MYRLWEKWDELELKKLQFNKFDIRKLLIRNLLQYQWHQHVDEALQGEPPFWNFVRHVPIGRASGRHVT